jgi:RNA polymerase sigma-70 factor (ECF subfamily)
MYLAHSMGAGEAPSVNDPEADRAPPAPAVAVVARLPAFEALYREHFDFVWRTLLRLGVPRRDVEDQLQEVFKVVYVNREGYDGRASVRAWLFGITHNVSRSWQRGVRRKGIFDVLPEVLPDLKSASAEQSAAVREDLALLARVLDALDADLRDVFIMTELLEMTAREIGESLSLSSNTVSSRLRRAWIEVDRRVALLRRKHP